ncbi:hypothetical protein E8E14_001680 [Neopestalotiopsis sp. 37M]|nr:hypothetical protein E8E14_001680 [Neopestalotiopsis sp. 37M]
MSPITNLSSPTCHNPPIGDGSVVTFMNLGSGTCMDLSGGQAGNNVRITGWQCHGGDNQKWQLQQVGTTGPWPIYMIKNKASGTYMDLFFGEEAESTPIVGWEGHDLGNPHQRWRFVTSDPGGNILTIRNIEAGTYIDLFHGGKANGTFIGGWDLRGDGGYSDNSHQHWKVITVTPS